jgi:hypothetical protein
VPSVVLVFILYRKPGAGEIFIALRHKPLCRLFEVPRSATRLLTAH